MTRKAILTDVTKCVGCNECVAACKQVNDLPPDVPRRWSEPDGLSARNWTSVLRRPEGRFVRKQCRHCLEPACVAVCPVGALKKTESGAVVYDQKLCIGCRYCMLACPYGIPRYDWDRAAPYIEKCTFCTTRKDKPGVPACTEVCPTEATVFFEDRQEALAEAKRRLTSNPKLKLYGDANEIGGTCVLYVSDVDLGFLSYGKDLGSRPMPDTIAGPMHSTPFVFLSVGLALGCTAAGVSWIINRRMKLQAGQDESEPEAPPSDEQPEAEGEGEPEATTPASSPAPPSTAEQASDHASKESQSDREAQDG
ncbi:MAG: 4Fe-4S dicluster domain-containing protein [Phycisphaerae bacterium]|nr:4Fe-4S dicluster domain-containing protein [Phycisphaerae bacterium]